MCRISGWLLAICLWTGTAVGPCAADTEGPRRAVSAAKREQNGLLVHTVYSEYQAGETRIKVLLPDRIEPGKQYPALYVLPVEAGEEHRYGDGLEVVRAQGLHNKHQLVCVWPTFSHLPWYADHPTSPQIRQESYLLRVVLPAVERDYPVLRRAEGRWLLGFSKSGWGAMSLLLRHPEWFGRAAAWDAPLTEPAPVRFGMGEIFGTQENFDRYRVETLVRTEAGRLGDKPRLVLLGFGNFRDQHVRVHEKMLEWGVPHVYRDGPVRSHHWDSGWVPEAVALLASLQGGAK